MRRARSTPQHQFSTHVPAAAESKRLAAARGPQDHHLLRLLLALLHFAAQRRIQASTEPAGPILRREHRPRKGGPRALSHPPPTAQGPSPPQTQGATGKALTAALASVALENISHTEKGERVSGAWKCKHGPRLAARGPLFVPRNAGLDRSLIQHTEQGKARQGKSPSEQASTQPGQGHPEEYNERKPHPNPKSGSGFVADVVGGCDRRRLEAGARARQARKAKAWGRPLVYVLSAWLCFFCCRSFVVGRAGKKPKESKHPREAGARACVVWVLFLLLACSDYCVVVLFMFVWVSVVVVVLLLHCS